MIAYQIRQSFPPGEITPEEANRLGCELAKRFTKGKHAFIVCTHIDKAHIHNHIIWDSVSLDHSRKFRDFLSSARAVRRLSDTICIENGYSIVENPKRRGKSYNQWLGSKPPCHRDQLRNIIDEALKQKPSDLGALLKLLQEKGVVVKQRGKSISLQAPGWNGYVRLNAHSLGTAYGPAELTAVLKGEKQHTPNAKNIHQQDPSKVGLLVDVQEKLQAGKGAGYVRWANAFNLKQMAQTMNYLTEHNLLDYADLSKETEKAVADFKALSEKIKTSQERMTEISELRKHIINYSKTRNVYTTYRKAGYSKAFKAAHESEILLHQAAKKYFDSLGLEKLPTVKSLHEEFSVLLSEKKAAYADYRTLRDQMKELLTVKANVDRLLGKEESAKQTETVRRDEER